MKVILFGATGMVGQGVLRECLLDPEVTTVLAVGRSSIKGVGLDWKGREKLHEIVHENLFDLSEIEVELTGYDACIFCLGVSSAGMSEEQYTRTTFDLTLAVAETLLRLNPTTERGGMVFEYVSGQATDSTERGRMMWARVKGRTENALMAMGFKGAFMFRPGAIEPLHGIRSKTWVYQIFYDALRPVMPLLRKSFPKYVTTTEQLGKAMLRMAKVSEGRKVLENLEINKL